MTDRTSPETETLLAAAQAFVDRKYVARADARQKEMGLAYVEAERQDLAREIVRFAEPYIANAGNMMLRMGESVDALRAELDRVRGHAPCLDLWRPIETAPKDGTTILGFMPKYYQGKGGQSVVLWLHNEWSDMRAHGCDPSHWMPLPQGPDTSTVLTCKTPDLQGAADYLFDELTKLNAPILYTACKVLVKGILAVSPVTSPVLTSDRTSK